MYFIISIYDDVCCKHRQTFQVYYDKRMSANETHHMITFINQ